jgi:hypothetical protein
MELISDFSSLIDLPDGRKRAMISFAFNGFAAVFKTERIWSASPFRSTVHLHFFTPESGLRQQFSR